MIEKIKEIKKFKNLKLIKVNSFYDKRGFFQVPYNFQEYKKNGIINNFSQDSISFSKFNVLRGLHFQLKKPFAQLLTVLDGSINDVVVDLRKGSKSFGQHIITNLNSKTYQQIYIPVGFAHGFYVTSEKALLFYKSDGKYNPKDEYGIIWNDKNLNIRWNNKKIPILSKKDKKNMSFNKIKNLILNI